MLGLTMAFRQQLSHETLGCRGPVGVDYVCRGAHPGRPWRTRRAGGGGGPPGRGGGM